ncbi:MAG: hypothetical protein IPF66_14875 [Holophagales bacterium]|nr:hypothetical protein [Holophagales bacterium]
MSPAKARRRDEVRVVLPVRLFAAAAKARELPCAGRGFPSRGPLGEEGAHGRRASWADGEDDGLHACFRTGVSTKARSSSAQRSSPMASTGTEARRSPFSPRRKRNATSRTGAPVSCAGRSTGSAAAADQECAVETGTPTAV